MMTLLRALLAVLLLAVPVQADEMAFYMRNGQPRAVVVELYSQSRQTVWPGDDQVYLLEKGEKKSVPVICQAGERICWGAWLNGDAGTFFGVGPDNRQTCENCCTICVGKTTTTIDVR